MRNKFALSFVLLFSLILPGCSSANMPIGQLAGNVVYKKTVIRIGTVSVLSEDGKTRQQGAINAEGVYLVDKVPVGKVKITVQFPDLPDSMKVKQLAGSGPTPKELKLPGLSAEEETLYKSIASLPEHILNTSSYFFVHEIKEGKLNQFDLILDKLVPEPPPR